MLVSYIYIYETNMHNMFFFLNMHEYLTRKIYIFISDFYII
jgi:hypothetical protein